MANRAYIRFRNVTIPNYAEVSNVFARFTSYSNIANAPVNLRCAFVDADNPSVPSSYAELQALDLTDWVDWSSLISWTDGENYDSPSLTTILQSVIEREGWSNGNSLILVIEDVSSNGQRGFSSIQFNDGNEKVALFATYDAREVNLVVDEIFTSTNWEVIQYYGTSIVTIEDEQIIVNAPGAVNTPIESNWYSPFPIDAQITVNANSWAGTGYFSVAFYIQYYETDTYRFPFTTNNAWMRLTQRPLPDDYLLETYLNGDEKVGRTDDWRGGSTTLTLRMSCSATGRVDFYLNGSHWHRAYFADVSSLPRPLAYTHGRIILQTGSSVDGNDTAIWSGFQLNTGSPIYSPPPIT